MFQISNQQVNKNPIYPEKPSAVKNGYDANDSNVIGVFTSWEKKKPKRFALAFQFVGIDFS